MEIQREEELLKFIRNLETKEDITSTELENLREWRAERLALINTQLKGKLSLSFILRFIFLHSFLTSFFLYHGALDLVSRKLLYSRLFR